MAAFPNIREQLKNSLNVTNKRTEDSKKRKLTPAFLKSLNDMRTIAQSRVPYIPKPNNKAPERPYKKRLFHEQNRASGSLPYRSLADIITQDTSSFDSDLETGAVKDYLAQALSPNMSPQEVSRLLSKSSPYFDQYALDLEKQSQDERDVYGKRNESLLTLADFLKQRSEKGRNAFMSSLSRKADIESLDDKAFQRLNEHNRSHEKDFYLKRKERADNLRQRMQHLQLSDAEIPEDIQRDLAVEAESFLKNDRLPMGHQIEKNKPMLSSGRDQNLRDRLRGSLKYLRDNQNPQTREERLLDLARQRVNPQQAHRQAAPRLDLTGRKMQQEIERAKTLLDQKHVRLGSYGQGIHEREAQRMRSHLSERYIPEFLNTIERSRKENVDTFAQNTDRELRKDLAKEQLFDRDFDIQAQRASELANVLEKRKKSRYEKLRNAQRETHNQNFHLFG